MRRYSTMADVAAALAPALDGSTASPEDVARAITEWRSGRLVIRPKYDASSDAYDEPGFWALVQASTTTPTD